MYYSRPASANGHGHGHSHGHGQPRGLLGMNPSMATPGLPFAGLQGQSTADVPVQYGPNEPAVRYDYDYRAGVWKRTETTVSVSNQPCQAGSLRLIFRLKDFTLPEGKQDCVAKIAKDRKETRQCYFTDVEMQAVAKRFAEEFNKRSPPKPIDFVVPWVVEFKNRPAPNGQGRLVMGVEPLLRGAYYKHTNNFGWVSNDDRNTPQAFSHFTYAHSGGQLLVCDIQGVGDVYTDPQIHSRAAPGRYGQADLGVQGINKFFSTHRCNAICQFLQLPVVSAVKSRQLPQGVTPCPVLPTIRLGEARTT